MADHTTSENEKTLEEEAHRRIASHEVLTLETLPRKITSLILAAMTIDVSVPYVVSRSTLQTPATRKKEDASARRDLRSLCMVSKRMVSKARPALYRNILVKDAGTLVLLYRTFLEKPQLGIFVKRMSLDICESAEALPVDGPGVPIIILGGLVPAVDTSPPLSYAQHGFGDHLAVDYVRGFDAYNEISLERLYILQFGVLCRTNGLESLDWNLHPQSKNDNTHSNPILETVVNRVLGSLWNEISPRLSRLKELQLIGKEQNCAAFMGLRVQFAALICRYFLTLPRLQQIVWFNHAHGWFDAFSCRWMSCKP